MIALNDKLRRATGFDYVLSLLKTNSPYGAEFVKRPHFFSRQRLEHELDNVEGMINAIIADNRPIKKLELELMQLKDIRRSIQRLGSVPLDEVEMYELKRFLLQLERIFPLYNEICSHAQFVEMDIDILTQALNILDPQKLRMSNFFISDSMNPRLKPIRESKRAIEREIATASDAAELIMARQLIVSQEESEERCALENLSEKLAPYAQALEADTYALGRIDFTIARARLAMDRNGVKPRISDLTLVCDEMRNPMFEDMLKARSKAFTPVSCVLSSGATVITGANMGGKSVTLKSIALNVLLANAGMFAFAREFHTPVFEHVFMLNEDMENINGSLSSFGGEIIALNNILKHSCSGTLILVDEFARGTNPEEGSMLSRRLTELLDEKLSISVLTTHFDNVAQCASKHYRVRGLALFDRDAARTLMAEGVSGVEAVEHFMDYGLAEADKASPCPKDAENICRLLLDKDVENELFKA